MAEEATQAATHPARDSAAHNRRLVERGQQGDTAWLFRIAHNLAMDHFRANRRWQPEEEVPEPEGESEPSAEAAALRSIGRQSMLELIDGLSTEQQQVLTLKFVFNQPNADVATILDKTEGATKSLQHRALVSLQKQISRTAEP
jgi:RNA polymerase sigma-70 factor (ECF subfamily)